MKRFSQRSVTGMHWGVWLAVACVVAAPFLAVSATTAASTSGTAAPARSSPPDLRPNEAATVPPARSAPPDLSHPSRPAIPADTPGN
jgi:hypothetical protein